jgi:hypothetical protein
MVTVGLCIEHGVLDLAGLCGRDGADFSQSVARSTNWRRGAAVYVGFRRCRGTMEPVAETTLLMGINEYQVVTLCFRFFSRFGTNGRYVYQDSDYLVV